MRHGGRMFSYSLSRTALVLGLALLSAAPLSANDAEEFNSYTQGRTIHFSWEGQAYGAERYLPGQRVIWSFLDGRCVTGEWYMQSGDICFVYEDRPEPQCWRFDIGDNGLSVSIARDHGSVLTLRERLSVRDEMVCLGPEVGV
jgi:hypothetical protein